jgi:CheY-like chemotaxis protein
MGTTRGTILVVDDDRDILEAISEVLRREGYAVVSAGDGIEATTVLASTQVDLILLDLLMPAMSGWELLEQRANDPSWTSIPVIVVSAAPREVAPGSNVRAVIPKPFARGVLLDAIATHLRPPVG